MLLATASSIPALAWQPEKKPQKTLSLLVNKFFVSSIKEQKK